MQPAVLACHNGVIRTCKAGLAACGTFRINRMDDAASCAGLTLHSVFRFCEASLGACGTFRIIRMDDAASCAALTLQVSSRLAKQAWVRVAPFESIAWMMRPAVLA
jgi:hypothetical protein